MESLSLPLNVLFRNLLARNNTSAPQSNDSLAVLFRFLIHFSKSAWLNAKIKKKTKPMFVVGAPFFSVLSFHVVVVCNIRKDIGHINRFFFRCVKNEANERVSERASEQLVYTLSKDVCCVLIMYSCMSKSSA